MQTAVKFSGGKEIAAALLKFGDINLSKKIVRASMYPEAQAIQKTSVALAPKGARITTKSGKQYRKAKKYRSINKALANRIVVVQEDTFTAQHAGVGYSVVCKAPHGHLLELGTTDRYRGLKLKATRQNRAARKRLSQRSASWGIRRGYTGKGPKRPFFMPAWERQKPGMTDRIAAKMWRVISHEIKYRGYRPSGFSFSGAV